MAKGWKTVGTTALEAFNLAPKYEKIRRERRFENAIRNTPIMKRYTDLEEQIAKDELKAEAYKKQLLEAYDAKILKSKKLIKKAKALRKRATA